MTRRLHAGAAAAVLALLGGGCSGKVTPTGGLVIVMRTDGTVQPDKLEVNIGATDGSRTYLNSDYTLPDPVTLPATIAVVSNGNAAASVLVNVSIWKNGTPLDVRQDQVFEIPTERVAELDVVFSAKCTPQVSLSGGQAVSMCGAMSTCDPATGGCTTSVIHAGTLPTYGEDGGSTAIDGGTLSDDGGDGAVISMDGPPGPPGDAPPGDAPDDTTADGGTASSDATVEGSADSGSAPTDAPADAPAESAGGQTPDGGDPEIDYATGPVTLTVTPFTVMPGGEVYQCQTFANPWGRQVDVKSYTSTSSSSGFLQMTAFYAVGADAGAAGACPGGGLMVGPFTYTNQLPAGSLHYPATVGANIAQTTGFTIYVHRINTGSTAVTANDSLTMYVAKPSVVTNHAGVLYLDNVSITVPPNAMSTASDTYAVAQNLNVLSSVSITTKEATNFVATLSSGPTLYTTTMWDQPTAQVYATPLAITAGTSITWKCTFNNTSGTTLTFGESFSQNVQCISSSVVYPVSDPTHPVIGPGY